MIALCRVHADQADNGAFTNVQLRQMKRTRSVGQTEVSGKFEWMRQDILAVVGGNFYYDQPIIFQINDLPCIWFTRDDAGYLLLNFQMPSASGHQRARIENNFWTITANVDEIICPPGGRTLEIKYDNGDKFRVEFQNIAGPAALASRYQDANIRDWADKIRFPVTIAEIWEKAAGTTIEFGPKQSNLPGAVVTNGFFANNGVAILLNVSSKDFAKLFR